MGIKELREELHEARNAIRNGRQDDAVAHIDQVLKELRADRLLTTNQARELLGIGSVNTLKLLVKKAGLNVEYHGNRMMIPVGELDRLQESALVQGIRTSDRVHVESSGLGGDELSPGELSELEESRPGSLPWSTTGTAVGV